MEQSEIPNDDSTSNESVCSKMGIPTVEKILMLESDDYNAILNELSRQESSEQSIHASGMQRISILTAIAMVLIIPLLATIPTIREMGDVLHYANLMTIMMIVFCIVCGLTILERHNQTPGIGTNLERMDDILSDGSDLEYILLNNRLLSLEKLHRNNTLIYNGTSICTRVLKYDFASALIILTLAALA